MSCDHELTNEWARCSGKVRQLYVNRNPTCIVFTTCIVSHVVPVAPSILKIMEKHLMIASASALSASALTFLACRYLSKGHQAKVNVYETEKFIGEYIMFHFGKPDELLPYGFGPTESLDFPKRCALECIKYAEVSSWANPFALADK